MRGSVANETLYNEQTKRNDNENYFQNNGNVLPAMRGVECICGMRQ